MAVEGLLQIGVQRGKAPGEQVLLGAEVVVKGPCGDARLLADLPNGDLVKALLAGQVHGGLQNGLLGLFGLLFSTGSIVLHGLPPLDSGDPLPL